MDIFAQPIGIVLGGMLLILVAVVIYLLFSLRSLKGGDADGFQTQLLITLERNTELVNQQLIGVINSVNSQIHNLQDRVDKRLAENAGAIERTHETVAKRLTTVHESLARLDEAQKRILEVGKDISTLQDILKAPKLRGGLGELFLGDLLAQILPARNFTLKYGFSSGEIVDAVINLGSGGMVPIDSKFPMENFTRLIKASGEEKAKLKRQFLADVKKHIDSIADKYIRPDEGTLDFALMYIPAENIYYETIIRDDELGGDRGLQNHAISKHVIPVSPNSLYAYLTAILLGLKGLKIEEEAKKIIGHISRLNTDLSKFKNDFETLGTHIVNTKKKYDDAQLKLTRFEDKLVSTESIGEIKAIEEK